MIHGAAYFVDFRHNNLFLFSSTSWGKSYLYWIRSLTIEGWLCYVQMVPVQIVCLFKMIAGYFRDGPLES